jgi:hypothetical protein
MVGGKERQSAFDLRNTLASDLNFLFDGVAIAGSWVSGDATFFGVDIFFGPCGDEGEAEQDGAQTMEFGEA